MTETMTAKILRTVKADPTQRNVDIAKRLGCSSDAVGKVRHRYDVKRPRVVVRPWRVSPENVLWLENEAARLHCTTHDLLNGILTDARLEAQPEAAE